MKAAANELNRSGVEFTAISSYTNGYAQYITTAKEYDSQQYTLEKEFKKLFTEYRAITEQSMRTQIVLSLPDMGLKEGQCMPLQIIRRDAETEAILGGIALVVTG